MALSEVSGTEMETSLLEKSVHGQRDLLLPRLPPGGAFDVLASPPAPPGPTRLGGRRCLVLRSARAPDDVPAPLAGLVLGRTPSAIGGIYYSAFTLLLLAVTLVVRLVPTGDRRSVARASGVPAAIGALSLTALVSVAAGQDKSTLVTMPAQRGFWESELYAGKLMDLILPWIHHRVDVLQSLTVAYNSRTTPSPEEPALGLIALAGVAALLFIMLSTLIPERVKPTRPDLSSRCSECSPSSPFRSTRSAGWGPSSRCSEPPRCARGPACTSSLPFSGSWQSVTG
jgi:hypothetical protein